MTDGDDLLRAIVETPGDNTVRLVYADWLTENGQAERGEFIRVQCALADMPGDNPRRAALEARETELLAKYAEEWRGVVGRYRPDVPFSRGFVTAEILLVDHTWNPRNPGQQQPIDDAGVAALAACPSALWLTRLHLQCVSLGDAAAESLASSRYLTRLNFLILGGEPEYYYRGRRDKSFTATGVRLLAASPNVAKLIALDLSCHDLDDAAVESLTASPYLRNLETLDLRNNRITKDGIEALIASQNLPKLTMLGLSNNPGGPSEDFYYDWDGTCASSNFDTTAGTALEARFGNRVRVI